MKKKGQKNRDTFSMYACHPCAGTMLIFSVSFQFFQMTSEEVPNSYLDADYLRQTIMPRIIVMGLPESALFHGFVGNSWRALYLHICTIETMPIFIELQHPSLFTFSFTE